MTSSVEIVRSDDMLKAYVGPSGRAGLAFVSLLLVFAILASFGALTVPGMLADGEGLSISELVWVLFLVLTFPWLVFSNRDFFVLETLSFSGGVLALRRSYLGLFGKTQTFRVNELEDLRYGGLDDGTVEFEARGETYWLRNRLREQAARTLVEDLNRRIGAVARC